MPSAEWRQRPSASVTTITTSSNSTPVAAVFGQRTPEHMLYREMYLNLGHWMNFFWNGSRTRFVSILANDITLKLEQDEVRKVGMLERVVITQSEKMKDELVLKGNDIELVSRSVTLINHVLAQLELLQVQSSYF
ncbi:hypothetical protein Dimus_003355 [Dionaea muscipula]